MREMLDRYVKALPKILNGKRRMIDRGLMRARAKCPVCGETTLQLQLAAYRRDRSGYHIHWSCDCGFGGME